MLPPALSGILWRSGSLEPCQVLHRATAASCPSLEACLGPLPPHKVSTLFQLLPWAVLKEQELSCIARSFSSCFGGC